MSTESKTEKELIVIGEKLDSMEKSLSSLTGRNQQPVITNTSESTMPKDQGSAESQSKSNEVAPAAEYKEDPEHPYWMDNNDISFKRCEFLAKAKRGELDEHEIKFWKDMIKEYLLPLDKNEDQEKKQKQDLKEFKNSMSLGFVLLNAMWVTAIFMLQSNTAVLGWKWPLGAKGNNDD